LPTIADLADTLWAARPAGGSFVIGLTGGVASGKSTLAAALVETFSGRAERPTVERVGTDGFLYPNAVLTERGVLDRKGFPETYDRAAMIEALNQARLGPAPFPGYSHLLYDIDPTLTRSLDRPDILIIEGLGLDRDVPLDLLVYLDAERADQEAWYVARFLDFWERGRDDSRSFYFRFRDMDRDGVIRLAAMVWSKVNLPNLEAHIEPVRETADIVVRKGADHAIAAIQAQG
jgi:type I pantothenate kinase